MGFIAGFSHFMCSPPVQLFSYSLEKKFLSFVVFILLVSLKSEDEMLEVLYQ